MKKITVTLSDEAEKYFNEVAYSLDTENGRLVFHSEIINHCLKELAVFEKFAGQSLTDYLLEGWADCFEANKGLTLIDKSNNYLNSTEGNYNNSDHQDRFLVDE